MKPWTPSFFLPVLVLVLLGGCSKASFYPLIGSVGGATVGKAISEGDVQKLVQQQLDEKMDDGFFDSMLDEVYGFLKLCLMGVILWNIIPIIYTRYVQKKSNNNDKSIKKTKKNL
jgi:uncharacterized membrane protein YdjX (TVP38/TMEM64 family)